MNDGRVYARPAPVTGVAPRGRHAVNTGAARPAYLYVPAGYDPSRPGCLAVMLHGAGGQAEHGLDLLQHLADAADMILIAPASVDYTWDVIADGAYGADVALIDHTLDHVFRHYAVDRQHLAIGGFSDGASYALSLGVANGDLFTHVIAFSPGFVAPLTPRGRPKVYISHGKRDRVLPIKACSRRIVPRLRQEGYEVSYHEFDGEHIVPPYITEEALGWFLPIR